MIFKEETEHNLGSLSLGLPLSLQYWEWIGQENLTIYIWSVEEVGFNSLALGRQSLTLRSKIPFLLWSPWYSSIQIKHKSVELGVLMLYEFYYLLFEFGDKMDGQVFTNNNNNIIS